MHAELLTKSSLHGFKVLIVPTFIVQWLNTEIFTETLKYLEEPYLCNVLDIGGSTLSVGSSECFSGSSKQRCKITGAATSNTSLSNEV